MASPVRLSNVTACRNPGMPFRRASWMGDNSASGLLLASSPPGWRPCLGVLGAW